MRQTPHLFLRPDTADLDAAAAATHKAFSEHRGRLAELLATWSNGEITTLCKALEILRDSNHDAAERYQLLDIVPRPEVVQRQIDFWVHGERTLDWCISVLERCKRRG